MSQIIEIHLHDKKISILYDEYHGYCRPDDAKSQSNSSHDISLVWPE